MGGAMSPWETYGRLTDRYVSQIITPVTSVFTGVCVFIYNFGRLGDIE